MGLGLLDFLWLNGNIHGQFLNTDGGPPFLLSLEAGIRWRLLAAPVRWGLGTRFAAVRATVTCRELYSTGRIWHDASGNGLTVDLSLSLPVAESLYVGLTPRFTAIDRGDADSWMAVLLWVGYGW